MDKKKGLLLSTSLLSVALIGAVVVASSHEKISFVETNAISLNTILFEERKESPFTSSMETTAEGLVMTVTAGDKTDWHYGLVNWSFPVSANTTYYCEFIMTVNSNGYWNSDSDMSRIVLVGNEDSTEGRAVGNYFTDFTSGNEFTIGVTFTSDSSATSAIIDLKLGSVTNDGANNFVAKVSRFYMKKDSNVGEIVNRIDFESGEGFASRWKTQHTSLDFCNPSDSVLENLIYDYSALYPAQRTTLASIDDIEKDTFSGFSVDDSVLYFADRLNITLE